MSFHPDEGAFALCCQLIKLLPEVQVFYRAFLSLPAVPLPAFQPAVVKGPYNILGVAVYLYAGRVLVQRL